MCSKNIGVEWTEDVHRRLQLSPPSASKNDYKKGTHWNEWRTEKCKSNEYKIRRLILRSKKKIKKLREKRRYQL